ncbi:membrane protein [Frigidibacter albus]|nr:DMT family transporter [Frigidibacter albus]GGH52989.1 membrane protein [Frigidibacter albus]
MSEAMAPVPGVAPVAAAAGNRTMAAAGAILIYAVIIGFTDNFVKVIAAEGGLWQFHAIRSVMALALFAVAAPLLGLRLWPRNPRAVAARSLVHGTAMLFYFGSLAFLPVAVVAAGLFTAPIFVLLLSRFAFGEAIGPFRILAVALGFLGTLMVLDPGEGSLSPVLIAPVIGGFLYALGNIATRRWCAGESAETLVAGFFGMLGIYGVIGMAVLALAAPEVPGGAAGFVLRGWVWPSAGFMGWTFVQAAGSLLGILMMVKGYQMAEASRAAVFEYTILPCAAFWSWFLWGEMLGGRALLGIVLIVAAGALIAARSRA